MIEIGIISIVKIHRSKLLSVYSFRRMIKHRYDYDNAMVSTGQAFYEPAPTSGNYMEYHYHHLGRPGRRQIVDRVVKYKYPPQVGTNYQKDYAKYNSIKTAGAFSKADNFNVEKEHKIINPHKVEKLTINRIDYQPFNIQPREPKKYKAPAPKKYAPMKSAYQQEFQNWGPNEVIHEKDPQYPCYSLPFKGTSAYARTFCGGSNDGKTGRGMPFGLDAVRSQNNGHGGPNHGFSTGFGSLGGAGTTSGGSPLINAQMGKSATNLRPILGTTDVVNHFETTNQGNYKNYQIKHRPQTCKPNVEAVKTFSNPNHFKTSNKHDYKKRPFKPLAVDMIPYP
jgi:hypothetical protein